MCLSTSAGKHAPSCCVDTVCVKSCEEAQADEDKIELLRSGQEDVVRNSTGSSFSRVEGMETRVAGSMVMLEKMHWRPHFQMTSFEFRAERKM